MKFLLIKLDLKDPILQPLDRYEDLMQDPSSELKRILRGRGLQFGSSIDVRGNIEHRSNETNLCHPRFTPKMYSKIVTKLNKRMETKVGYSLIEATKYTSQQSGLWALFLGLMWWIIVPTLTVLLMVMIPIAWKEIIRFMTSSSKNISENRHSDSTNPQWIEAMDRATGQLYYVNRETGRVQWNRPSHFQRYKGIDPIFNKNAEYFQRQSKMD